MAERVYSAILERSLARTKAEFSTAAFALLFSEMVRYSHGRISSMMELEDKLSHMGEKVGRRVGELLVTRERGNKREVKAINMLVLIQSTLWKMLFGKAADSLEKAGDDGHNYMLSDNNLLVNQFISIPSELGDVNCGAFVAGIIKAVLEGSGFYAKVTTHSRDSGTTFLIEFDEQRIPLDALEAR